jgi:tetratricopeptide (TPR) repeat protein
VSTYRSFVLVRLTLATLAISVLGSRGAAQSIDDPAYRIGDASVSGNGVPRGPFSNCGHPLMNIPRPCQEDLASFDASSPQVTFHPAASAGTVSADALRHPLSGKALRSLQKAQRLIQAGDHVRALEQLREAVKISFAAPYAYALLGEEHLRLGEAEAALPELQQAVRLLPSNVADQANLGLALLMTGETRRAEQELRRALYLDPNNSRTQLLLGVAVLNNGSHDEEGIEYLRAAAPRFSVAHVVLAAYYARAGLPEAAEQEARVYLGSEVSTDQVVLRNWIESMARESAARSRFVHR